MSTIQDVKGLGATPKDKKEYVPMFKTKFKAIPIITRDNHTLYLRRENEKKRSVFGNKYDKSYLYKTTYASIFLLLQLIEKIFDCQLQHLTGNIIFNEQVYLVIPALTKDLTLVIEELKDKSSDVISSDDERRKEGLQVTPSKKKKKYFKYFLPTYSITIITAPQDSRKYLEKLDELFKLHFKILY